MMQRYCGFLLFFSSICFAGGKETYQTYCTVCHASGLAAAPKFQDVKDWGPRCQSKHLQGLVRSAIKGLNAMPANGTCMSCSEEDIKQAILYMVPKDESICH
ncbi:MAG: cytochrome c5 family protein [Gammaproteobacteria bacterium]|nr:cytochrome c5 family protein [Gammaproteobacteria bacterium]